MIVWFKIWGSICWSGAWKIFLCKKSEIWHVNSLAGKHRLTPFWKKCTELTPRTRPPLGYCHATQSYLHSLTQIRGQSMAWGAINIFKPCWYHSIGICCYLICCRSCVVLVVCGLYNSKWCWCLLNVSRESLNERLCLRVLYILARLTFCVLCMLLCSLLLIAKVVMEVFAPTAAEKEGHFQFFEDRQNIWTFVKANRLSDLCKAMRNKYKCHLCWAWCLHRHIHNSIHQISSHS